MSKLIYDPIHGFVKLSEKSVKIIDTPEFQRLRNIKQLGTCYYVFPGASHNRFEHSIGTGYLAAKMAKKLRDNSPDIEITDELIETIEIAGLCHDIGHGPFSHIFDDEFIKNSEYKNSEYKLHEDRSGAIVEYINKEYNIGISDERINFIKTLINPKKGQKGWVYQIVSNPINSLDVDKFDYLVRDVRNLGLQYTINFSRIIKEARIINDNICYPEKEIFNIYDLFHTRFRLHKQVYNHPVVKAIEYMLIQVFNDANEVFNISKSIENPKDFCKFSDTILDIIKFSDDSRLENAQKILNKIEKRELYKMIYKKIIQNKNEEKEIVEKYKSNKNIIHYMKIGYNENLVDKIFFYNHKNPDKSFHINKNESEVVMMFPNTFYEESIRIFESNN